MIYLIIWHLCDIQCNSGIVFLYLSITSNLDHYVLRDYTYITCAMGPPEVKEPYSKPLVAVEIYGFNDLHVRFTMTLVLPEG